MRSVLLPLLMVLLVAAPTAAAATSAHVSLASAQAPAWSGQLTLTAGEAAFQLADDSGPEVVIFARHVDITIVRVSYSALEAPIGDVAYSPDYWNETYPLDDVVIRYQPSHFSSAYARVTGEAQFSLTRDALGSDEPVLAPGNYSYLMNASSRLFFRDALPTDSWAEGSSEALTISNAQAQGAAVLFFAGGHLDARGSNGAVAQDLAFHRTRGSTGLLEAAPIHRDDYSFVTAKATGVRISGAAPVKAWANPSSVAFNGEIDFARAVGRSHVGAVTYVLNHEILGLHGTGRFTSQRLADGARSYDIEGSFDRIALFDGRTVIGEEAQVSIVVALALLALAVSKIGRQAIGSCLGSLYTRIHRTNILGHPQRVRLYEAIKAKPGSHLRELQRTLDCGWGELHYHFNVLKRTGLLVVERRGKHDLVHLRTEAPPAPEAMLAARGQATRVYAALARAPKTQKELASELSLSRQLIAHHLRGLEHDGLVVNLGGRPKRFVVSPAARALGSRDEAVIA